MTTFNPFGNTDTTINTSTGESLLLTLSPAKFDIFVKLLSLFEKSSESIKIQDSNIVQKFGPATMTADITTLFEKDVNLEIVQPKKYIKLFKQFKNNTDINFIEDGGNNRYIITNDEIRLFLPKQAASTEEEDTMMPDFEGAEGLFDITIDKDVSNQLIGLSGDVNFVEYLIQEDKLKGIHVPETAIYLFSDYLQDEAAKTLDETNADLILRTGVFLAVTAEKHTIQIGKLANGNHFSLTDCDTGMIHINVFENLEVTTGGNLLI
jgi:hypothetical protein